MNLENLINEQLSTMAQNGSLEKIVQAKIEKFITDVLDDSLRSYSDYSKAIKEKLNTALKSDLDQIDFPQYSNIVSNVVVKRIGEVLNEAAKETVGKKIDEILDLPPKEIKLSEIIEKYKELIISEKKDDCSCDYDPYQDYELSLIIEKETERFSHIYLHSESIKKARYSWDKDEKISKYQYDIRFGLNNGKVYTVSFGDNEKVEERIFNKERSGLSQLLLNMYCMGSSVILDEEDESDYDLSYSLGED